MAAETLKTSKTPKNTISKETQREVDRLLMRELREECEHQASELISLRSEISLRIPKERDFIISAFTNAIFNSRAILEKAGRIEERMRRGK